jgi:hypothetical protein
MPWSHHCLVEIANSLHFTPAPACPLKQYGPWTHKSLPLLYNIIENYSKQEEISYKNLLGLHVWLILWVWCEFTSHANEEWWQLVKQGSRIPMTSMSRSEQAAKYAHDIQTFYLAGPTSPLKFWPQLKPGHPKVEQIGMPNNAIAPVACTVGGSHGRAGYLNSGFVRYMGVGMKHGSEMM